MTAGPAPSRTIRDQRSPPRPTAEVTAGNHGDSQRPARAAAGSPPLVPDLLLAGQGSLVGLLTGIAGVGGGFAIVPALVLLAGLPMARASGTSLLLITVNALVALVALGHWPGSSLPLMIPLLLGGAGGAMLGQRLAPQLGDRRLRQAFSGLLIGSALLTGAEAIHRHHQAGRSVLASPPAGIAAILHREPVHHPRASGGI